MTMHLVGPYLTTTRYSRKNKNKMTKRKYEESQIEWMANNKKLKRNGRPKISFETFCDERRGIVPKVKVEKCTEVKSVFGGDTPYLQIPEGRGTSHIPSLGMGDGVATKKETTKYTGTLIKGIATMHKSNAIPIIDEKQAIEVSQMRRG